MKYQNVIFAITLSFFFILEIIFPHFKNRNVINQIIHTLINVFIGLINGIIGILFSYFFLYDLFVLLNNKSIGLLNTISASVFEKIIIGFVLFDLWMYFWHLLNHKFKIFWLFHRTHHTDINLDASTSLRFHFGEIFFFEIFRIPIYFLLGLNLNILLIYKIFLNIITLFHHSNIRLNKKIDLLLKFLIVTPNMHRVHHSQVKNETNSNYSSIFSFWDRIFRSFRKVDDTTKIILGLEYFRENKYQKFTGILITPFLKIK